MIIASWIDGVPVLAHTEPTVAYTAENSAFTIAVDGSQFLLSCLTEIVDAEFVEDLIQCTNPASKISEIILDLEETYGFKFTDSAPKLPGTLLLANHSGILVITSDLSFRKILSDEVECAVSGNQLESAYASGFMSGCPDISVEAMKKAIKISCYYTGTAYVEPTIVYHEK